MRLQDKRSFKAINFDDADEYLEDGDTRDMLNVRVGYSESGNDGIVTNVKGTVNKFSELSFSLPGGNNKCVGTCTDEQNNRLIWLNHNQASAHGIYAYNTDSNTIDTILTTPTLSFTGDIIHSIDILNGNLAWTDNSNRPRAINVPNALAGVLGSVTLEELINDAKAVPMKPPVCTPVVTFNPDYIQSLKSFQFIYRYVFIDGEKGAWSTVSKLVPTAYRDNHIEKIILDVSTSEVFTKPELRRVIEYVEFASRELYTLNFNQFLRITTSDLVSASGIVNYFDTESKTPLDTTGDTSIAFYENPIKAGTVCFQNDRKFYADCTEGYDAFALSLSNVNTQVVPASGSIPYLSDCNTHINDRYLKPDSEYSYSVEFHDKYGRKSGAIDLPDLSIKTQEQLSNDYKANVLQFSLNLASQGSYPSWAEKFEIIRSDNKTVTYFVQGRVNNVLYCTGYDENDDPVYLLVDGQTPGVGYSNDSDTGALELHIDISNWLMYETNIPYTFTEGDRLTFFTMGSILDSNSTSVFKGLKIKERRGDLLIVDYPLVGRTKLNHAMIASTETSASGGGLTQETGILSRFIVGDNGVLLYSRIQRQTSIEISPSPPILTPLTFPFPYTDVAKVSSVSNFPTTSNHLYGIELNYESVVNTDSIDIFIVGANGYFIKGKFLPVSNSFNTWSTVSTGVTTDINCIESSFEYHHKSDLIMVGNNGVILKYNLAGNTISQQVSGTTENLNHIYRNRDTDSLVAVGDNGTILRTIDNGTTWTQVSITNCQNLNCVYFKDSDVVAVGDEGLVMHSTDSGVTWVQVPIGTSSKLNCVDGDGTVDVDRFCYIAGESGYLIRFSMLFNTVNNTYSSNTTKNINFFQTYELSGTPVFDLAITVGDFDLLQDVSVPTLTFTNYSGDVSELYGTLFLNYRAKIEIYSPKTVSGPVIYYETGDNHPVGVNYTFNKGKESDGDVFLIKKDFRGTGWTQIGDLVFSMTPDSLNTAGTWDKDLGRPNTVLLFPEKQQRRNITRYSQKYVQDSRINGLSNFIETAYEPIPNEFGWVRKITPVEFILLINAERESATAYIDQTVFRGTDGRDVAATSDVVINNIKKLQGGFGCTNPESIVQYLGSVYWLSSNKGAVCRYNNSNGIFPISEYKARTYFYDLREFLGGLNVVGGYEPRFKNYLLTTYTSGSINLLTDGDNGTFENTTDPFGDPPSDWGLIPSDNGNELFYADQFAHSGTRSLGDVAADPSGGEFRLWSTSTNIPVQQNSDYIIEGYVLVDKTSTSLDGGVLYLAPVGLTFEVIDSYTITSESMVWNYIKTTFNTGENLNITIRAIINIPATSGDVDIYWDDIIVRLDKAPETIAFQEGSNRWVSKYSFWPERYGYVSNEMLSFLNGVLWKHNASDVYNNFHGTQYVSKARLIFNREPNSQKSFTAISLEADKAWAASSITTTEGQESFILSGHFEKINNEWWADVKQDINTPNMASVDEALINGDFMQSNVLDVILETPASDVTKLRFANLYSNFNERTNK